MMMRDSNSALAMSHGEGSCIHTLELEIEARH